MGGWAFERPVMFGTCICFIYVGSCDAGIALSTQIIKWLHLSMSIVFVDADEFMVCIFP
jgi:hypothetical protein